MNIEILKILVSKGYIKNIIYFEELDSTNNFAKENVNEDDVLIIASSQYKGRGRFDRVWEAKPYENLTISLIKELKLDKSDVHLVNFYTSYVILSSIKILMNSEGNHELAVKWPNDVLLNGKKVSGILTELKNIDDAQKKFIIGIGINLNQKIFPGLLDEKATSISIESKKDYELEDLVLVLIDFFYTHLGLLNDKKKLMNLWRSHFHQLGKFTSFKLTDNSEIITGRILEVQDDGGIKIEVEKESNTKKIAVYHSGEISFIYSIN